MTHGVEDNETDRLARAVAALTGEPVGEAVRRALAERLERVQREHRDDTGLVERLGAIARHCAALPDLDTRSADEIIGYDAAGVPRRW